MSSHYPYNRLSAQPEDDVAWVRSLCSELHMPTLADFGVTEAEIPLVVAQAQRASSMQGNSVGLSDVELTQLLSDAVQMSA